MRINDNALNCVAYIGIPDPKTGAISYGGTGFFVQHEDENGAGTYLITARHVAERVEGSDFILRIGGVKEDVRGGKWVYERGGRTIDAAILEHYPPHDSGAVRFSSSKFLSHQKIGTKRIGPGDQTYVVGNYSLHPGEKYNRPVVHTGHIALMPDRGEGFSVKNWPVPVEGYAVEAQTLHGISGAPAFVRRSIRVVPKEESGISPLAYGAMWLLGLWMASWDGIPDEELAKHPAIKNAKSEHGDAKVLRVPVGMGIVVPAYQIVNLLNDEDLRLVRRERRDRERAKVAAVLDDGFDIPDGAVSDAAASLPETDNPEHKSAFRPL